jgi:hypothetical protein
MESDPIETTAMDEQAEAGLMVERFEFGGVYRERVDRRARCRVLGVKLVGPPKGS